MTYKPPLTYINHGLPSYCAPNGLSAPNSTRLVSTTAGNAYLTRFYAFEDITVTKLSIWLLAGVASSTIHLGIYNTSGNLKVSQNGLSTVVANSQSKISATSLVTASGQTNVLTAGSVYYCALSSSTTNVTVSGFGFANNSNNTYANTSGIYLANLMTISGGSAALPATISTMATSVTNLGAAPVFVIN